MAELIAVIILGISLGGALLIVGRKIPALLELPATPQAAAIDRSWTGLLQKAEKLIQKIPFLKNFSWSAWIEKNLSKTRVLALKTDNKITGYLTALHVWEEKKKNGFSAGTTPSEYWTDVKKFVQTKSGLRIKPLQPAPVGEGQAPKSETGAAKEPQEAQIIQVKVNEARKENERKRKNRKRFSRKGGNW